MSVICIMLKKKTGTQKITYYKTEFYKTDIWKGQTIEIEIRSLLGWGWE